MAPDEANQKRKRGRPPGASKTDENVSIRGGEAVEQPVRDDNVEARTAPKRRGRPRKSDDSLPEEPAAEEPSAPQEEAPKRRGRPRRSLESAEVGGDSGTEEQPTQPVDTSETAPKSRGRPARIQAEQEAEESAAQAEETSNPEPKKRGRKARPQQAKEAVEEGSVAEVDEPTEAALKRKGRPARTQEVEQEAGPPNEEEAANPTDAAPKRRGRPARAQETEKEPEPTVAEPEESPNTGRKKRGWPAKDQGARPEEPEQIEARPRKRAKAAENIVEEHQQEEPRGRGRPSRKQAAAPQEDIEMGDAEPAEADGRRSRRGRASNEDESREEAAAEPGSQQKDKRAKNASKSKGRSGHVVQQEEAPQKEDESSVRGAAGAKGPRGTLTEVSVSEAQNQAGSSSRKDKQPKKKDQPQRETEPEEPQPQTKPQRRRRSSPEPSQDSIPDPLSTAKYRHLAPITRNIPRATIASKWTPLDTPAISTIDNLILDSYIPVLESLGGRSDTRYTQAQTILRTFANRLHSKLVKGMPFPPASIGTKTTKGVTISAQEAELNFEKVIDASSHLQRQLDPLLHSVALLKAEKEKEEAMLEADYRNLRRLEENARAQARGWKERGKRDHVLAPGRKDVTVGEYNPDEEAGLEVVKKEKQVQGSVFKGLGEGEEDGEEELMGLAKQIGNHMESMRGNLSQIDGVVPAIQKSRAALQGVLGRYLSEEAYEAVVLG
ncbi:CENP-Q, a CENPA-CAD centromere complex subunit-domain-containing protein [Apiosordaria backusii]|uniref:CENP-Q, a CENPA-CAD centromere complex subunit-domain-containing protein n=1 Tax=Apiosordaria backusii TaxID=314023 RepID=A0AA40K681_9PEZI|nr:CENP-Q, a CENPA-CAD centromere complex subunit-domain-containing protein [Apiosordaria backusii]